MLLDRLHRSVEAQILTLRLSGAPEAHQALVEVFRGLEAARVDPDAGAGQVLRGRVEEVLHRGHLGVGQFLDQVLLLHRVGDLLHLARLHPGLFVLLVLEARQVFRRRREKVSDDLERSLRRRRRVFRLLLRPLPVSRRPEFVSRLPVSRGLHRRREGAVAEAVEVSVDVRRRHEVRPRCFGIVSRCSVGVRVRVLRTNSGFYRNKVEADILV